MNESNTSLKSSESNDTMLTMSAAEHPQQSDNIFLPLRTKRINSNSDIFERDVQVDYFPNSPVSMNGNDYSGSFAANPNYELDPKSPSTNYFFINQSKEALRYPYNTQKRLSSASCNGAPVFNSNIFCTSPEIRRTQSHVFDKHATPVLENSLKKVPTHVLSVDNYINSDMDKKCCNERISSSTNHTCEEDASEKNGSPDGEWNAEGEGIDKGDEFDERMDYFNHSRSSFDNYIDELNSKKGKKNENNPSQLTKLLQKQSKNPAFDECDETNEVIDDLTAEVLNSNMLSKKSSFLEEEEYENRRLSRERSRSLTSLLVKGLSESFK